MTNQKDLKTKKNKKKTENLPCLSKTISKPLFKQLYCVNVDKDWKKYVCKSVASTWPIRSSGSPTVFAPRSLSIFLWWIWKSLYRGSVTHIRLVAEPNEMLTSESSRPSDKSLLSQSKITRTNSLNLSSCQECTKRMEMVTKCIIHGVDIILERGADLQEAWG